MKQEKGLYELRKSTAPACLLEVDFHDSATGVAFLTSRRPEIAEAIARCIIEADGKEFVPETPGECADKCVAWGLMKPGRWEEPVTKDIDFTAQEGYRILGWGNGDPAFQYDERPEDGSDTIRITTFNGLAQVILSK